MTKLTLDQINELDRKQLNSQEVIYLKLRTAMTLQQIADVTGQSRQRVAQVVDGAMAKIRAQNETV